MVKNTLKGCSFFLAVLLLLLSSAFMGFSSPFLPVSAKAPMGNAALSSANANRYQDLRLYPGGTPFGIKFLTAGVMIVGFHDSQTCHANPAKQAGLQENDIIIAIGGKELGGCAELSALVEASGGKPLALRYHRNGQEHTTTLTPVFSKEEGKYVSGIYVRDNGAGIGTVTFVVPETGAFGGLGHGICDGETGELIPMQRGSVVGVTISGVVKGLAGAPGEVKGYFSSGKTGTLLGNTHCGVYGIFAKLPDKLPCEPLPVGLRSTVKEGKATIYCTLDGTTPRQYNVEISNIQRDSLSNKCFTVKVTDAELIGKTGGIIQGMSGSPIIQNGKLVGAVTHVLINDPTTGYGIFIENMLNAAQMPMAKAS